MIVLSGSRSNEEEAKKAGAEAFLAKPFSPLDLLELVEQVTGGLFEGPFTLMADDRPEEQILLYARDLRRLLELERGQRYLLKKAYEETIGAFAGALEAKDFGTGAHSKRVVRYATELTRVLEPALLDDPSLEYGFLLHDVGKIGIPDSILQKPGSLTREQRTVMRTHAVLGTQLLSEVPLLQGEGLGVIRSHHERWDGSGYPDLLGEDEIPLGGRIFAVADTLDAMTSERPYRAAFELGPGGGRDRPPVRPAVRPAGRRRLPQRGAEASPHPPGTRGRLGRATSRPAAASGSGDRARGRARARSSSSASRGRRPA